MIDHIVFTGEEDYKKYWDKFVKQEKTEFGFIRRIESFSDKNSFKFIVYFY